MAVVSGAHMIVYSANADADRAFLRDVLGFPHIDVGHAAHAARRRSLGIYQPRHARPVWSAAR